MATTLDNVKAWLRITTATDDAILDECVAAANGLAGRYAGGVDPASLQLGLTMLAARLYRRRLSPEGTHVLSGDAGQVALSVARTDPDIARLLRIDGYTIPQVG